MVNCPGPRLDKMRREKRALMQGRAVRTVNWKEISKAEAANAETDEVGDASGRHANFRLFVIA